MNSPLHDTLPAANSACGGDCSAEATAVLATLSDCESSLLVQAHRTIMERIGPGAEHLLPAITPPVAPEWEPVTPFGTFALPNFPTDALPDWLRKFVEAESERCQTPPDMAGVLALSAVAVAVAGKAQIVAGHGWFEPMNLFCLVAMPPASRKSAIFASIVEPLEAYEREENARRSDESRLRLVADDVTPERLAGLLAEQGGRMAVMSAEGGIFDIIAGKYTEKGGTMDVFLKGHSGDGLRVDRIGRAAEYIAKPALTLGLAIQPDVLRGLAKQPGFRGRGLLARFLYSLPESNIGHRKIVTPPTPLEVTATYHANLSRLLAIRPETDTEGKTRPLYLNFAPEAYRAFLEYRQVVENRLQQGEDLETLQDWGGKLAGAVARIIGLLHLATHGDTSRNIEPATVANAIRLGDYFTAHAKAAHDMMGADADLENARHVLQWIERKEKRSFSRNEAHKELQGKFKRIEPLALALQILVERHYLREREPEQRSGAGRKPGAVFDVNPHLQNI